MKMFGGFKHQVQILVVTLLLVGLFGCGGGTNENANALPAAKILSDINAIKGDKILICHKPGTPAEQTLELPASAVKARLALGDVLGACGVRPACSKPPTPTEFVVGTEPSDKEPSMISEAIATLEGASEVGFNAVGAPITFKLSCPTLQPGTNSIVIYDNGMPLPYEALTVSAAAVTITNGLLSGKHEINLLALDSYGYTIEKTVEVWIGNYSIRVKVIDEAGTPVANAKVIIKLSDNPKVTGIITTDNAGSGIFQSLPNRSYNLIATTTDNKLATNPASVFDGLVTLQLKGFKPSSGV